MTEKQRATRNLNAHADAHMARIIWGKRYANQPGGCMDFWDLLSPTEQRTARECVDLIKANKERAPR